jgi:hypothetical protein
MAEVMTLDGQCHAAVDGDGHGCDNGGAVVAVLAVDDDGASLPNGVDCGDDDYTALLLKPVVVDVASDQEDGSFRMHGTRKEALGDLDFQPLPYCSKEWDLCQG